MAGITPIGAVNAGFTTPELVAAEFQVRALRQQLDVANEIAEETIRLIEISVVQPDIGRLLDISV